MQNFRRNTTKTEIVIYEEEEKRRSSVYPEQPIASSVIQSQESQEQDAMQTSKKRKTRLSRIGNSDLHSNLIDATQKLQLQTILK